MLSFNIPSNRVYLFDSKLDGGYQTNIISGREKLFGGATSLPLRPRIVGNEEAIVPLIGGVSKAENESKYHAYICVNSLGQPLQSKIWNKKIFLCATPSAASKKIFNTWIRLTKQTKNRFYNSNLFKIPKQLHDYLSDKKYDSFRDAYLNAFEKIDDDVLSKQLLIRITAAGKNTSIRNYIVKYIPNTSPNMLEVTKRIVLIANTEILKNTDQRPSHIYDLEHEIHSY